MMEEQQLISRIKDGDDTALKKVYEENRKAFLDFSSRYPLSKEDALDIYQDAVVAFCENVKKGKLDTLKSSLSTYIFAIGKYKIYALLKKEQRQVPLEEGPDLYSFFPSEPEEEDPQVRVLREAFKELGSVCKKVLTLFYYEGKKLEEIQQTMGYESKDVLKSQKSRCLKKLKELASKKRGYE